MAGDLTGISPPDSHSLAGELLSPTSTDYLLNVIRSTSAFTDGIRLKLTTPQRLRVATTAGWFNDGRNEGGIVFAQDGTPDAIYSLFARVRSWVSSRSEGVHSRVSLGDGVRLWLWGARGCR